MEDGDMPSGEVARMVTVCGICGALMTPVLHSVHSEAVADKEPPTECNHVHNHITTAVCTVGDKHWSFFHTGGRSLPEL